MSRGDGAARARLGNQAARVARRLARVREPGDIFGMIHSRLGFYFDGRTLYLRRIA